MAQAAVTQVVKGLLWNKRPPDLAAGDHHLRFGWRGGLFRPLRVFSMHSEEAPLRHGHCFYWAETHMHQGCRYWIPRIRRTDVQRICTRVSLGSCELIPQ